VKIENIDVTKTVEKVQKFIEEDKTLSLTVKAMFELLLVIVNLCILRLSLNSKNSSKPPSTDLNRKKKNLAKDKKKPGGQNGHDGTNLKPVNNPDQIVKIKLNKKSLPKGKYTKAGYESRQVVDIKISRVVTEYRAEILRDDKGTKYTAPFPTEVTQKIQYGASVKAHSVYMSGFQMIPYNRIADYFADQMKIPLSAGSIFNFNKEAFEKLELFESIAKSELIKSSRINADETGINIGGKRKWLHLASNDLWAYFYPHDKRGAAAMDEAGILPNFTGVLCHDHWISYYTYTTCLHSLCNAHHLRELEAVVEFNQHQWAKQMQELLCEINDAVNQAGGMVSSEEADKYRQIYRKILSGGDIESPPPELLAPGEKKKKGRIKKEKHRNLLERLRNFEDDVLRFMETDFVPFTNNMGENDLRMIKVQQKISGCFRSIEGAAIFCRIRGYLLSSQKHGVSPTDALTTLFNGQLPDFCKASAE
jgi:transposase